LHTSGKEWKKTKKFPRSKEMGIGEEWKGELRDVESRMPGVKCGYSSITIHDDEEQ
jgi:hypothetical protein